MTDIFADVRQRRRTELPHLLHGTSCIAYLDNMGAPLPPRSVMGPRDESLITALTSLGNPHSNHPFGSRAHHDLLTARQRVLAMFRATKEYDVVFTSGTTAAVALLGHSFPFTDASVLAVHKFSHNSVLGLREVLPQGAAYEVFAGCDDLVSTGRQDAPSLCCVPAECNFSGFRPPLQRIVAAAKLRNMRCLVDAAAMAGKADLSLDGTGIDFVVLSFYKLFGCPTGLGALLVHKTAQPLLRAGKRYFGGGTVAANRMQRHSHELRETFAEAMEDGTPNFQAICILNHLLSSPLNGTPCDVEARHRHLRRMLVAGLKALKHNNGSDVAVVHEVPDGAHGGTVAFSLKDDAGGWIGYSLVEKTLAGGKVYVRGGCFCNPGACDYFVGYSDESVLAAAAAGKVCWDDMDLISGKPTGAVRASFAWYTTPEDVDALLSTLDRAFTAKPTNALTLPLAAASMTVDSIVVYPVKGLPGVEVESWPLTASGLLCDREWMIVDEVTNRPVASKEHPAMSLMTVTVDWRLNTLTIRCPNLQSALCVVLDEKPNSTAPRGAHRVVRTTSCSITIRGAKRADAVGVYDGTVNEWVSAAIGVRCALVRCTADYSLSNSAPLLVVARESHLLVVQEVGTGTSVDVSSYRANIVVGGVSASSNRSPFPERFWSSLDIYISDTRMASLRSVGPCHRCQQVNVARGELREQPLAAIAVLCRRHGVNGITFGELFDVASLEHCSERRSSRRLGVVATAVACCVPLVTLSCTAAAFSAVSLSLIALRFRRLSLFDTQNRVVLRVGATVVPDSSASLCA